MTWQSKTVNEKILTRLSPFSFVILAGKPAGNACSKISSCPALAASYIRAANATAAAGSEELLFISTVYLDTKQSIDLTEKVSNYNETVAFKQFKYGEIHLARPPVLCNVS
jgi:hypothetical protein